MARNRNLIKIPLTAFTLTVCNLIGFAPPSQAGSTPSATKGAEVYCFMRASGNNHEVSWNASYEIIKRQKSSLFKTSPKHAAVMIIETVVDNPADFNNCGTYLGDLFGPSDALPMSEQRPTETAEVRSEINKGDRYSY